MDHFKPAGEQARWKYLYDLLKVTDEDQVLTYDEMAAALNLDPLEDRMSIRAALYRAAKELEEVDRRAVAVVPNRGYRVVRPKEHVELARRQHTRSTKALVRGHSKATNVDLSKVDPETRKALEMMAGALAMQMDMSRRIDKRMSERDKVIESLVESTQRSDSDRDEMAARLRRLEEKLGLAE